MFDFRRITLFCLEKRLSKHKMTIFSKNLRGSHGPLGAPLATSRFVSLYCAFHVTNSTNCVRSKAKYPHRIFYLMRKNRHYLFYMSYFEVFGVLTGVGVDVSKFFGVGAGVLKPEAGLDSESEKCNSVHLRLKPQLVLKCSIFPPSVTLL